MPSPHQPEPGLPILAGTDASATPGSPARVPHGASQHRELELLVEAGLPAADAQRYPGDPLDSARLV